MMTGVFRYALVLMTSLTFLSPAGAQGTLRIAMTASDIPTATGMPNNGFEGMRFMGYPIFEGLVLWNLSRADNSQVCVPALRKSGNRPQKTRRSGFSISGAA